MILDQVKTTTQADSMLTAALVVIIVILLAGSAGVAVFVGKSSAEQGSAVPPTSGDAADGATGAGSVINSPSPSADDADNPVDHHAAVTVALSPSAEAVPRAQEIADLLSRYFTAINRHDYDAWLTTVSTAQAKRDRDSWTVDYSTTYDDDIYISDIEKGDPTAVRMQFVSHQSLEFAPAELPAECVRWDVTYEVLDEGVGLRVGLSLQAPALAAC